MDILSVVRSPLLWLIPFLAVPLRGGLRPPPGETREQAGVVSVDLGFGKVVFSSEEARADAPGPLPQRERQLACNRGTFSLSYLLATEGGRTIARELKVDVRNKTDYIAPRDPRLEEHEAGHRRINEAAARRMETTLGHFSTDNPDLKKAEKRLRAAFRKDVEAVKSLHKEWDATNSFARESAAEDP